VLRQIPTNDLDGYPGHPLWQTQFFVSVIFVDAIVYFSGDKNVPTSGKRFEMYWFKQISWFVCLSFRD
jgi:hypothetical protein